MIGTRIYLNRGESDEAEKPFWISFSDFMTALMALFLIVMATSLLIMSIQLRNIDKTKKERDLDIDIIMQQINEVAKNYQGKIKVDIPNKRISFEDKKANFKFNSHNIKIDGIHLIRQFTPELIDVIEGYDEKKWFKSIIVKGFTDTHGSYLYNLLLSQRRASSVVCVLLQDGYSKNNRLTDSDKRAVARYFHVGGVSSNFQKETAAESRRVEFGIEFRAIDEAKIVRKDLNMDFGNCRSLGAVKS